VDIRYYIDPESGEPHIYEHGIDELEVEYVLNSAGDEFRGVRDSRIKIGQTAAGRYIKVVYVPDMGKVSVFVITAYELQGKAKTAFRRRNRRKPR
jgi:hypothetical protein